MKLSIVTAYCGAMDITEQFLEETLGRCSEPHELVIVAQAETPEECDRRETARRAWGERGWRWTQLVAPDPLGSTAAFNAGHRLSTGDIVAMLHNDLMVRQPGWDAEVLAWFEQHPETGVAGFHGAAGIGSPDIYRTPYRLPQLARWDTFSNLDDAEAHGARVDRPTPAAVLDGMALIARRADLAAWGGLDEELGAHHMYDNDICLRAMAAGRTNYMLPIRARHLSGQTANFPRYGESVAHLGGDAGVHRMAHERFYAKWRGRLPASIAAGVAR